MAECPYGKASLVFPLSIPAETSLGIIAAASSLSKAKVRADVVGYTTSKVRAAGACSLRLALSPGSLDLAPGNYVATVRAKGHDGWLVGLANTQHSAAGAKQFSRMECQCLNFFGKNTRHVTGLEVVVMARPDHMHRDLMYLPDATIQALWPLGQAATEVQVLEPLLLKQLADCPEQWLRDRLLKLADMLSEDPRFKASGDLLTSLESAGLRMIDGPTSGVGPHDAGNRIDPEELGYWNEEMDIGHRCGATMDGGRMDVPDHLKNPDEDLIMSMGV